jgi:hypothetical protein
MKNGATAGDFPQPPRPCTPFSRICDTFRRTDGTTLSDLTVALALVPEAIDPLAERYRPLTAW